MLPAIETVAAGLFRDTPYPWVADDPDGMSLALFKECQEEWNLWVAADDGDRPVGFAAYAQFEDQTWLGELSVDPAHARRGLGARLIEAGAQFYGGRGSPRLTLTTFRDVLWNAPYYTKLNFTVIDDLSGEPHLAHCIEKELARGMPNGSRVAMQRALAERGTS